MPRASADANLWAAHVQAAYKFAFARGMRTE
jgi:hypothetical protein